MASMRILAPAGKAIPVHSSPTHWLTEVGKQDAPATEFQFERRDWQVAVMLGLLTFVTFLATLRCGFINLDDPPFVYGNIHVQQGLTFGGLRWAFSNLEQGAFLPLTWISLQLDAQLYAKSAWGYHLTNVLLHSANAMLLFALLRMATGSAWPSAAAAAVFAVHPLRVESVAWVTERKDVLSAFFGLLALIAYVHYTRRKGWPSYGMVLSLYGMSLLSKSTLVTLPCLLMVLDHWPLGRLRPPRVGHWVGLAVEKLPFVIASVGVAAITFLGQRRLDWVEDRLSLLIRVANASLSYVRYARKTIFPKDLAIWYAFRQPNAGAAVAAIVTLLLITFLVLRKAHQRPWLAAGWLWYVGTLVPMIGLVMVGGIGMADRYSYFPTIGLLIMVLWSLPDRLPSPRWSLACASAAAIMILTLCLATQKQISYWQSPMALWEHDVEVADSKVGRQMLVRCTPTTVLTGFTMATS